MNNNALAVANHFIGLAVKEEKPVTLLGLIKRVYIAHGFSLAIFHKSLLDSRFDRVEAWKYGPVIPCVYHSFKQFRAKPITGKTEVMEWNENDRVLTFHAPELKDEDAKKIVEMVWKRYSEMSDSQMVSLTHQKGTPWDICYIEGRNNPIPDELTDAYYRKLVNMISKNSGC